MSEQTTNNTTPVDSFDFFLQLEDVNDGFSKETQAMLKAEAEQYKAERSAKAEEEASWSTEAPEENDEVYAFWEDDEYQSQLEKYDPFADDETETEIEDSTDEETPEVDEEISEEVSEHLPEAYDVGYETILALPDGREMSIETLQSLALEGEEREARENAFNQRVADFEAQYEAAKGTLELASLEADRIIESYDGWDWDELADTDAQTYTVERRYYEKMLNRKQALIKDLAKIQDQRKAAEQAAFQEQSASCVAVLKVKIPQWNDRLYEELLNFGVNQYGVDPEKILTWNDPSQFLMLYDGYQRYQGKKKADIILKNGAKAKGKYVSPGGAIPKTSKQFESEKAAYLYNQGKLSQADAFKFLED